MATKSTRSPRPPKAEPTPPAEPEVQVMTPAESLKLASERAREWATPAKQEAAAADQSSGE